MSLPWWWGDVKGVMNSYHVPVKAWLPVVLSESGGYAGATNLQPPDESYGLFQENRHGGLGSGHTPLELYNPSTAADIAGRQLDPVVTPGQPLDWWAISKAGWPGATVSRNDPRVKVKESIASAIGNTTSDQDAWDRTSRWHSSLADSHDLGVPGDPGEGGGTGWPGLPDLDPTKFGQGLASGFLSGLFQGFNGEIANVTFMSAGILCVVAGVIGLAFAAAASRPGQTALKVAAIGASGGTAAPAVAASTAAEAAPAVMLGQGATRPT